MVYGLETTARLYASASPALIVRCGCHCISHLPWLTLVHSTPSFFDTIAPTTTLTSLILLAHPIIAQPSSHHTTSSSSLSVRYFGTPTPAPTFTLPDRAMWI